MARGATTRSGRAKLEEEEKLNGGWKARSQEAGREEEERRSGDLASVRGPTGRWNPRSRLIAIKAPLRLRL